MVSGVEVLGFLRSGRRISGVRVIDLEGRTEVDIRARVVINAAGVWANDIEAMAVARPFDLRVSKGVHLVVPRDRIEAQVGLICRTERSVLLVIPWGRQWIIGTTDTGWDLDKSHPVATRTDTQYLLDRTNEVLTSSLGHEDVQGVYVGLRPSSLAALTKRATCLGGTGLRGPPTYSLR